MDSILATIKRMLGDDETYEHFNAEIITHINSALSILTQLGVGPKTGFMITGSEQTWSDLVMDREDVEFIKSYIYLKVKLVFDPPTVSSVLEAMKETIKEYESRIQIAFDS